MLLNFLDKPSDSCINLVPCTPNELSNWLTDADKKTQVWLKNINFKSTANEIALIPDDKGALRNVLVGVSPTGILWNFAALIEKLPEGTYCLNDQTKILTSQMQDLALIGWGLGAYTFSRYKTHEQKSIHLIWPKNAKKLHIERVVQATYFVRDLINTPAADLGPEELAQAAVSLTNDFGGKHKTIIGDDLLTKGFPAIYAVGSSSHRKPRFIDLSWGNNDDPKVTLIGKGVCFDSGGLNIKPAGGMKLMKKDMGGAAHALGLAMMIMSSNLPLNLRVLIPAVDNSIGPEAMRPLDVVETRAGLNIEIGHTDAEGRVILADAITLASEGKPQLICDFATLTGAARIALGTELPALFVNENGWGETILNAGQKVSDPLWRMPLWQDYKIQIESSVADISNEPKSSFGGAITASLFLERFVGKNLIWSHVDLMAWNLFSRPGRPEGGEAMGMRAFYEALIDYFEK